MAAPSLSYVQYFIASDGDTEEHPNVFVIRKPPAKLVLADVQAVRAWVANGNPVALQRLSWQLRAAITVVHVALAITTAGRDALLCSCLLAPPA